VNEIYLWAVTNWKEILIAALVFDRFLNNLLTNCPYLKQNKWYDLVQGIFNAIVQTATHTPPEGQTETASKTTTVADTTTTATVPNVPGA
jgi:hypothetical protein